MPCCTFFPFLLWCFDSCITIYPHTHTRTRIHINTISTYSRVRAHTPFPRPLVCSLGSFGHDMNSTVYSYVCSFRVLRLNRVINGCPTQFARPTFDSHDNRARTHVHDIKHHVDNKLSSSSNGSPLQWHFIVLTIANRTQHLS